MYRMNLSGLPDVRAALGAIDRTDEPTTRLETAAELIDTLKEALDESRKRRNAAMLLCRRAGLTQQAVANLARLSLERAKTIAS